MSHSYRTIVITTVLYSKPLLVPLLEQVSLDEYVVLITWDILKSQTWKKVTGCSLRTWDRIVSTSPLHHIPFQDQESTALSWRNISKLVLL
jgi:hypothetical protein